MGDRLVGIEEVAGMRWSATGLPPGLWCDEPTGLILGVPERPGTYQVTVTGTEVLRWPRSWLRACERVRWLRWAGRWSR